MAAITVSPAPETSNTSRARAGAENTSPEASTSIMPFSERVTSTACACAWASTLRAAATTCASSATGRPEARASSARLGVMEVAPRERVKSGVLGSPAARAMCRMRAVVSASSTPLP